MKRIVLLSLISFCFLMNAEAQTKDSKKKTVANKTATKKNNHSSGKDANNVVLMNAGTNQAYGPASSARLQIADPTINLFNQRAAGAKVQFNGSNIAGMPKSTYGIAGGKILLRTTTATTPGTSYGSGAVGTGTAIQGAGTGESAIGVNGKSPYAGPWLWGDRRPVYNMPVGDSARRQ